MSIAEVDDGKVEAFAGFFRANAEIKPFDFCGPAGGHLLPPRDQPGVVDYFFFCTAHQFGFWHLAGDRYLEPMVATLDGMAYKGSDYVWRCATRHWTRDHGFFRPERLRRLTDEAWAQLFADDDGINPLPMPQAHHAINAAYGDWFARENTSPECIVQRANASATPLATFLEEAGRVPGYDDDPLQKKLQLLAVILENRPEGFLHVRDPDAYRPIIDYHLQRSALRTGLVVVKDEALKLRLTARQRVNDEDEREIRAATFAAVQEVVRRSGASVAAVDYFFFMNRKRCPEMSEPVCDVCPVRAICARRTELFQPVFRTTAY